MDTQVPNNTSTTALYSPSNLLSSHRSLLEHVFTFHQLKIFYARLKTYSLEVDQNNQLHFTFGTVGWNESTPYPVGRRDKTASDASAFVQLTWQAAPGLKPLKPHYLQSLAAHSVQKRSKLPRRYACCCWKRNQGDLLAFSQPGRLNEKSKLLPPGQTGTQW